MEVRPFRIDEIFSPAEEAITAFRTQSLLFDDEGRTSIPLEEVRDLVGDAYLHGYYRAYAEGYQYYEDRNC